MNLASLGRPDLRMTPNCLGTKTFGEQFDVAVTHARLDENFGIWRAALAAERLTAIGKPRREVRHPAG